MENRRRFLWADFAVLAVGLPAAVLLSTRALVLLAAGLLIYSLLLGSFPGRALLRPRFWLFVLSPLVICSLFYGEKNLILPWFRLSLEGLSVGLEMSLRALCLILTIQSSLSRLSLSRLLRLLDSSRLKGLGLALGVARNMLSTLSQIGDTVYSTLRLRGGFRKHPLRSLKLFVLTVVSNSLEHADDIVNAASARAFDPEPKRLDRGIRR